MFTVVRGSENVDKEDLQIRDDCCTNVSKQSLKMHSIRITTVFVIRKPYASWRDRVE